VKIALRTQDKATTLKMVASGEVDIGVVNDPPPSRYIKADAYGTTRLVAFVSANHPLVRKGRRTVENLKVLNFVIRKSLRPTSATVKYLERLQSQGVGVEVVMRCDSPQAVKIAVKRNMGVGILCEDVVREEFKKGEFKEVKFLNSPVEVKRCIVYHKRKALSPTAQAFLRMLQSRRPRAKELQKGFVDAEPQIAHL